MEQNPGPDGSIGGRHEEIAFALIGEMLVALVYSSPCPPNSVVTTITHHRLSAHLTPLPKVGRAVASRPPQLQAAWASVC